MRHAAALLCLLMSAACAREEAAAPAGKALSCVASEDGALTVEGAWVREQADQSAMTAAYFTLCNGTMAPVTLTGLSTELAGLVELHETSRDEKGVVSMAPTGEITLPPGELLVFEPGGKHAMLMSLAGSIKPGDKAALHLQFADGTSVTAEAVARAAVEAAGDHGGH